MGLLKRFKKVIVTTAALSTFLLGGMVVQAASVANGELIYKGGQTSSYVYSDIRDAKPSNNIKYKVWAAVKVGSNTYSSGWKDDAAYKQADRVWYANESSHYDYYQR